MYRAPLILLVIATGLLAVPPATAQSPDQQPAQVEAGDGALIVRIGDVEALRYHTAAVPAPQGMDPIYNRSGYIHPVRTPSGIVVTGDFAADHPHQHALFGAWTKTKFAGHAVDHRAGFLVCSLGSRLVTCAYRAVYTLDICTHHRAHARILSAMIFGLFGAFLCLCGISQGGIPVSGKKSA